MILEIVEYRPIREIVIDEDLNCDIDETRDKLYNLHTPEIMQYLRKQRKDGWLAYHKSHQKIDEYGDLVIIVERLWKLEAAYKDWLDFKPFVEYKDKLKSGSKYEVIEKSVKTNKIDKKLDIENIR